MDSIRVIPIALAVLAAGVIALSAAVFAANRTTSKSVTTAAQTAPMQMPAPGTQATGSFAGELPANSDQLAAQHVPYPAQLRPAPAGQVVPVNITLRDVVLQIAPGVKYSAWTFDGGAPGPVIHVRQGQTVKVTLTNGGAIPHSIDFHAARVAPNVAFRSVDPGKSITFSFTAGDPGVFMYHCGTPPVLMHIANGMYGAIVVDPKTPLRHADKEYVLVSGEWYLDKAGTGQPAQMDMAKAREMHPDWVTFNGYANQYKDHPLTANPGNLVRFYVVDAGPSLTTDFHIVGTILDRAYVDGDMSHFESGVQTVGVPAGGGAIFETRIMKRGIYPFVSHSFAAVDMGEVGLLNVGGVKGTMSH